MISQAKAVAKHGPSLEEFVREKNGREQPSKFRFMFGAGELGLPEHEEIAAEAERDYFYGRVVRFHLWNHRAPYVCNASSAVGEPAAACMRTGSFLAGLESLGQLLFHFYEPAL